MTQASVNSWGDWLSKRHLKMIPWIVIARIGHVGTNEHKSTTRGDLKVFVERGIGHRAGIETLPLVEDMKVRAGLIDAPTNLHHLVWIGAISMLKPIHNGFLDRKPNGKHRCWGIIPSLKRLGDAYLNLLDLGVVFAQSHGTLISRISQIV